MTSRILEKSKVYNKYSEINKNGGKKFIKIKIQFLDLNLLKLRLQFYYNLDLYMLHLHKFIISSNECYYE